MKTSEIIRSLRQEKDWSQKDMAEKLHMSVNGYSKIERGETEPNLSRLQQIADILGVQLNDLLPKNEGCVFFQINEGDDNSQNFYNTTQNLETEVERLKLILTHKDELLAQQARELSNMQTMLTLLKAR